MKSIRIANRKPLTLFAAKRTIYFPADADIAAVETHRSVD
jgi:hypothetical protein